MHLGIDFGSRAIKAAIIDNTSERASPLALGRLHYVPNLSSVAGRIEETHVLAELESAFLDPQRQRSFGLVGDLRNQAISPHDVVRALDHQLTAVEVHRWPCMAIKQALAQHAQEIDSIIVSVPDAWCDSTLALPIALFTQQVLPLALVPETLAAIVAEARPIGNLQCVGLSMGAGSFHITKASLKQERLEIEQVWSLSMVSGNHFRHELRQHLVDMIARKTRRLVLEDRQEAAALDGWIEACIDALQRLGECRHRLQSFGQIILEDRIDSEFFKGFCPEISAALESQLREIAPLLPCQSEVLYWGEMGFLFESHVKPFLQKPSLCLQGGLDCVAQGCAMIARDLVVGTRGYFEEDTIVLRALDGARTSRTDLSQDLLPLLNPLHQPMPSHGIPGNLATLELLNGRDSSPLTLGLGPLRIGRDVRSEIVIDSALFPSVSMAHSLITWKDHAYVIRDLGSTNGTFVNDDAVQERRLNSGDRIRLGKSGPEFRFRFAKKS